MESPFSHDDSEKMMHQPKITVLMPVYNAEKYLQQAIDSILQQTLSDFEFLIFDDGSTDCSREIIQSYNDARLRVFLADNNVGYLTHLNAGIDMARGTYLARMDADDISLPDRFEKQVRFLELHPDVALVGACAYLLHEHGQEEEECLVIPDDLIPTQLLFRNYFTHTSIMARTAIIKMYRYAPEYYLAEDYFLWSRISQSHKVAKLKEPLVKYRLHAGNVSRKKRQQQRAATQKVLRFQLASLGLESVTPEDVQLHFAIFLKGTDFSSVPERIKALRWIERLARVRNLPAYYDVAYYQAQLCQAFQRYFRYAESYKAGFAAISWLWSPMLPAAPAQTKWRYALRGLMHACQLHAPARRLRTMAFSATQYMCDSVRRLWQFLAQHAAYYAPGAYQDIIFSQSSRHFTPDRVVSPEYEFMSVTVVGKNLYHALSRLGNVHYEDQPDGKRTSLWVTTNNWSRGGTVRAKHTVLFRPTAHLGHRRELLLRYGALFEIPPERIVLCTPADEVERYTESLRCADHIIILGNETVRQTYLSCGVPAAQLTLLNCGIDADHFLPQERDHAVIRVVYPATYPILSKGFPFLMDAWRRLCADAARPPIFLDVLGDRCHHDIPVEQYADAPHTRINGKYIGGSRKHLDTLAHAHYVVFPSLSEGQAGTLLEAMSCGCVPIATRESGIDADRYGGWVVEAGSVESIYQQLMTVIAHHTQADWADRSLTVRRQIVRHHSWNEFRDHIANVCQKYV